MKKFIVRALAAIGAWVVIMIIVGFISSLIAKEYVPDKTIVEVDFEQEFVEYIPDDPVAGLMLEKTRTVRDVIEALDRAASDDRVVAFIARVGTGGTGLAHIQEIREAVRRFRAQGKPALAYAETFGEFGPGNGAYYLATAFDQIYLQPSGDVGLTGLMAETSFFRGTLEKLGITPRLDHRSEYKNAMNVFTERQYTEPHREALQQILESTFNQIVRGIAETRGIAADDVRALIDRGPLLGAQAVEAQLVDGLAYRDEVYAKVKQEKAYEDATFLSLFTYLERAGRPHTQGETIALIYGAGGVRRGKSEYDPAFGGTSMGSDTVAAAFRDAIEDEEVKAILFRVESPGGSYVASDTIWRETIRAKEAGKPVIVSMGNVAGSGGYFVAMAADKIVAQPATITGSIGVLGGKMLTSGFWEKLGLSWDELHTSQNATMWTGTQDYTPAQWAKFQDFLDRVYADFTQKVAQGRQLSQEQVEQVAKGRIWTGEDAQALGLVDELGGFPLALRLAREAAGIPEGADIHLKLFPPRKTFLQALLARWSNGAEDGESQAGAVLLRRTLHLVQPFVRLAQALEVGPHSGVLAMPEWELKQ